MTHHDDRKEHQAQTGVGENDLPARPGLEGAGTSAQTPGTDPARRRPRPAEAEAAMFREGGNVRGHTARD